MAKFGVYSVLALLACLGLQAAAQTTLDGPTSIEFFLQACDLADRIDNLCQDKIFDPIGEALRDAFQDDMLASRLAMDELQVTQLALLAAENPQDAIALIEAKAEAKREEAKRKAAVLATPEAMDIKDEALSAICNIFPGAC
jgi:hypothetical protein